MRLCPARPLGIPSPGALDGFCVFPELPSLAERGLADGVGNLYQNLHREGDLILAGRRVSDIRSLLRECLERWGRPSVITVDRWREHELRDHLEAISFPMAALSIRGQGFKDGGTAMFGLSGGRCWMAGLRRKRACFSGPP